jgi:hypothetical protein
MVLTCGLLQQVTNPCVTAAGKRSQCHDGTRVFQEPQRLAPLQPVASRRGSDAAPHRGSSLRSAPASLGTLKTPFH